MSQLSRACHHPRTHTNQQQKHTHSARSSHITQQYIKGLACLWFALCFTQERTQRGERRLRRRMEKPLKLGTQTATPELLEKSQLYQIWCCQDSHSVEELEPHFLGARQS